MLADCQWEKPAPVASMMQFGELRELGAIGAVIGFSEDAAIVQIVKGWVEVGRATDGEADRAGIDHGRAAYLDALAVRQRRATQRVRGADVLLGDGSR